jgi:hypothetical protein
MYVCIYVCLYTHTYTYIHIMHIIHTYILPGAEVADVIEGVACVDSVARAGRHCGYYNQLPLLLQTPPHRAPPSDVTRVCVCVCVCVCTGRRGGSSRGGGA